MNTPNSRSKELLNKVYDHLEKIDVSTLSMRELQDFLEVVQKGQFLETYGTTGSFGFGGFSGLGGFGGCKPAESTDGGTEEG